MKSRNYSFDWEEWANIDCKWSILTNKRKKYNNWQNEEFFKTGKQEIDIFFTNLKKNNIRINFSKVLDFGCGIGRNTKILSDYYDNVYGVDISKTMILEATNLHKKNKKIKFIHNSEENLKIFNNNELDLVFSVITLQHIPSKQLIINFLAEFMRILKPDGVLYFQLPSVKNYNYLKSYLFKLRGCLYYFFSQVLKINSRLCYKYLKLMPFMHMSHIKSSELLCLLEKYSDKIIVFNDESLSTTYLVVKKH